jgi:hypothetical protein
MEFSLAADERVGLGVQEKSPESINIETLGDFIDGYHEIISRSPFFGPFERFF